MYKYCKGTTAGPCMQSNPQSIDNFELNKCSNSKYYPRSQCKICRKAYQKAHRDIPEIKEFNKARRKIRERNTEVRDKIREYERERWTKLEVRERKRKYLDIPEVSKHYKNLNKEYRENNPDVINSIAAKRRASKL